MIIRELQCTDAFLKKYITHITLLEFEADYMGDGIKIPPLGFPVIQFHYGEMASFYNRPNAPDEAMIIGQITGYVTITPSKGTKLIGVNFKPYGFYNMFGISPLPLQDTLIHANKLFGFNETEFVLEQVRAVKSDSERFQLVCNFLKKHAKKFQQSENPVFERVVKTLIKKNGLVKIKDVVPINSNIRALQRYFKQQVGISPKLFAEILRHRFIVHQISAEPGFDWKHHSLDAFFFDQSHFDRDFQKFSGLKPIHYDPEANSLAAFLV